MHQTTLVWLQAIHPTKTPDPESSYYLLQSAKAFGLRVSADMSELGIEDKPQIWTVEEQSKAISGITRHIDWMVQQLERGLSLVSKQSITTHKRNYNATCYATLDSLGRGDIRGGNNRKGNNGFGSASRFPEFKDPTFKGLRPLDTRNGARPVDTRVGNPWYRILTLEGRRL